MCVDVSLTSQGNISEKMFKGDPGGSKEVEG